jgi:hypothetical protein
MHIVLQALLLWALASAVASVLAWALVRGGNKYDD